MSGGWYGDAKSITARASLIDKINSSGALGAKAIGDSLIDVAKIVEDREKTDLEKKKFELDDKKTNFELDKLFNEQNQDKINKEYLKYVNPETGEFDENSYKTSNPDSTGADIDTRLKVVNLKNAYGERFKKEENDKTSKILGGALLGSNSEQEFYTKLTPDMLNNIDGDTAFKIKNHYSSLKNDAQKIQMDKQNLSNQRQMFELEQKIAKQTPKKDVKAADDSLIGKNIGIYFGGIFDPATGDVKGLNNDDSKKVIKLQAKASEIYKTNPDLTHNEATALAIKEYENENAPSPTPKPDDKSANDPLGSLIEKIKAQREGK